jgi:hypothetical protein
MEEADVYVGMVEYVGDYETDPMYIGNIFSPFLHKRKSFEHERELRAVVWESQLVENPFTKDLGHPFSKVVTNPNQGLRVDIPINELIEKVVVAPTALPWFSELVENVSVKYGLDRRCIDKSRLYERRLR